MTQDRQTAIDHDFDAFEREHQTPEHPIDLDPAVVEFLEQTRETAFRTGWDRGQAWQADRLGDAPTEPCIPRTTVRLFVDVGAHGWVQPLAIIEHIQTGECFVDPRFPVQLRPSERSCVELRVTDAGLVAAGPVDRHRLSHEVDRARLRPLAEFHPSTAG